MKRPDKLDNILGNELFKELKGLVACELQAAGPFSALFLVRQTALRRPFRLFSQAAETFAPGLRLYK